MGRCNEWGPAAYEFNPASARLGVIMKIVFFFVPTKSIRPALLESVTECLQNNETILNLTSSNQLRSEKRTKDVKRPSKHHAKNSSIR